MPVTDACFSNAERTTWWSVSEPIFNPALFFRGNADGAVCVLGRCCTGGEEGDDDVDEEDAEEEEEEVVKDRPNPPPMFSMSSSSSSLATLNQEWSILPSLVRRPPLNPTKALTRLHNPGLSSLRVGLEPPAARRGLPDACRLTAMGLPSYTSTLTLSMESCSSSPGVYTTSFMKMVAVNRHVVMKEIAGTARTASALGTMNISARLTNIDAKPNRRTSVPGHSWSLHTSLCIITAVQSHPHTITIWHMISDRLVQLARLIKLNDRTAITKHMPTRALYNLEVLMSSDGK
jgi:hypothetical protein